MNSDWVHDVRLAARNAGRSPGFYVVAALTLAVGMTGAAVMFALIQGILLRPLPVAQEDRLVVSWRTPLSGAATHIPYRADVLDEFARASQLFERVTGVGYNGATEDTWLDAGRVIRLRTAVVMGDFFDVAGVRAVQGRGLSAADDRRGAQKCVVLSEGAWRRLFGGAPDVVGRSLVTRNHPFVVVGVMPADFEFPRGVEVWTTRTALATTETNEAFRTGLLRDMDLLGRLRPGVGHAQAFGELSRLMSRLDAQAGQDQTGFRPVMRSFKEAVIGEIDTTLAVLSAAVGLILIIASANVTNLLLMRGENRRTEFVVRMALGAGRAQLIRQLLAESLVIGFLASAVAIMLSRWALQTVIALVPDGVPRPSSIRLDEVVVFFTGGVALLAAGVSGAVTAVATSRLDLTGRLRAGGRGQVGSTSQRGRRALVAAQVALAVTVVAAAGLLIRSLERLQGVDMGLAHDRLFLAELDLPRDRYADQDERRRFLDGVVERIRAVEGIDGVTPLNTLPFAGAAGWDVPRFTAEGQTDAEAAGNPVLNLEAIHSTYFHALQIAILRGRAFTTADTRQAPLVAIISDAVAAQTWPQQDAVGKRVKFGGVASNSEWLTVVGVASTTRYRELATPRPTIYVPAEQFMVAANRLAIRASAPPSFVASVVANVVDGVDPGVQVVRVAPYAEYLRIPLAWPRFNALVLGVFALAALLLSMIGLYGVIAAAVSQRTREIGVRMALGATARDVSRLVIADGFRMALGGALAGLAIAVGTTRVLRGLLFETQPLEPTTLLGAAVGLLVGAVLASLLPARRATQLDPIELLRAE